MPGAKIYFFVVLMSARAAQFLCGCELVAPLPVVNPLQNERDAKDIHPTRDPPPEYYRCFYNHPRIRNELTLMCMCVRVFQGSSC